MNDPEQNKFEEMITPRVCPACSSDVLAPIVVTSKLSLTITDHDEIVSEVTQEINAWKCERHHRHVTNDVIFEALNNLSDAIKYNID